MRWVLEHLQVIIVIAGAIAYYVNQRRRAKEGLPPEDEEEGTYDTSSMDLEEAERTRRLQEELRRKREQRAGGSQPSVAPQPVPPVSRRADAPPPVFHDPLAEVMKDLARRLAPPPTVPPPAYVPSMEEQSQLQRQQEMEKRLQELEVQRRAALAQASAIASGLEVPAGAPGRQQGSAWLGEIRDPRLLRRAVVMNEIIGAPAALR